MLGKPRFSYDLHTNMVKVKKEKILIKPGDIAPSSSKLKVMGAFNPGAIRLPNGEIVLYARILEKLITTEDENYFYSPRMIGKKSFKLKIERFRKDTIKHGSDLDFIFKDGTKRLTFICHLRKVVLDKSGFNIKSIEQKPSFYGLAWDGELGVEDPRIVQIGKLYVMTYVSLSRTENISTSYAISNDCKYWYRRGLIFGEQNIDVVLFPEIINEKYVAFERPEGSFQFTPPHIWISYSKDLEFWGDKKPFTLSKKGDWDSGRVGAGPPPIKTEKGWLFIYHGILNYKNKIKINEIIKRMEISDSISGTIKPTDVIYCVGAVLLDLKNPRKVIAKTKIPILFPMKKHEIGTFEDKRVVFPTGLVLDESKKYILLYSGAGDFITTIKKISLDKIFKKLGVWDFSQHIFSTPSNQHHKPLQNYH